MNKLTKNGWTHEALKEQAAEKRREVIRNMVLLLFFKLMFFAIIFYLSYVVISGIKEKGLKNTFNKIWVGEENVQQETNSRAIQDKSEISK